MSDGGWEASAQAYIDSVDEGDPSRELLLDAVMLRLCGEVAGTRVLDAGCGEGRFSRMLARSGAKVAALDFTSVMVDAAYTRRVAGQSVVRGTAERLPFADDAFDLTVSYIVLVDVPDFRAAIRESARVLRPGGLLVVANVSFMSAGNGWARDGEGRRLHYPLDNYLDERAVEVAWSGIRVVNWHRPLGAYMAAYLDAGLVLRDFIEPMPADDSLRTHPRFDDWYRVPNFTVMRWQKPA